MLASGWTEVSFQGKRILLRLPLQILEAVWAFLKPVFWAASFENDAQPFPPLTWMIQRWKYPCQPTQPRPKNERTKDRIDEWNGVIANWNGIDELDLVFQNTPKMQLSISRTAWAFLYPEVKQQVPYLAG